MKLKAFLCAIVTLQSAPFTFAQGTWIGRAAMPTPRESFGIARTPDGLIYAIGGDGFTNTYVPLTTVEAYNPATNTWVSRSPMPTARYGLAAAYANGKIYAFGGYNFGPRNAVEAYDPITDTWATMAPMPSARHGLRAVTGNDGRIYVVGGDVLSGGANVATLEIYDPATNSWTLGPPMPNAKIGPGATLGNNGLIYVMGGGQGGSEVTSMFAYNPVTNAWTVKSSMAVARAGLTAATLPDGRIVVAGGQVPVTVVTASVEIYDPSTDGWTPGTPMTTARASAGLATAQDGRIYAIGGWIPTSTGLLPLTTNEAYTPAAVREYEVCLLYDPDKAVRTGATIPIKIQLCDGNGNNRSSSTIAVHATSLTRVSTSTSADIQDSGNANPDNDFRYDPTLGGTGGYIFNLKTTGLTPGTYSLGFTAGAESVVYTVQFQVR